MNTQQPTDQLTGQPAPPAPRAPRPAPTTAPQARTTEPGVAPGIQRYEELPESFQAALHTWCGSVEVQDAWTAHIFTLANAGACAGCDGLVGLCGGHDDTGRWWCRTCLHRNTSALEGVRVRAFSCDVQRSLHATLEQRVTEKSSAPRHECLAFALGTRPKRTRLGGEAGIQANCRRGHEVLKARAVFEQPSDVRLLR